MIELSKHTISNKAKILEALEKLNQIPKTLTLFVLDKQLHLIGSLTDGDIRRGFLKGLGLNDLVEHFMTTSYYSLKSDDLLPTQIRQIKNKGVRLLPVLDESNRIIRVVDFNVVKTILPLDAILMAGGRGERLRPLTDQIPKPMLKIGEKPIIEHNIDQMISFGIRNYFITLRYLGEQISHYLGNGNTKGVNIQYIHEKIPLGTIGAISLIKEFKHDHVLVMNSDLFTNLDYEDFYQDFLNEDADMSIATIPYNVDVPYAVLSFKENKVTGFKEKPSYTFFSNGGLYLIKKELFQLIPVEQNYNATDFIQALIDSGKKVIRFPIVGYWFDIGKPEDYQKVKELAKQLKL